MKTGLPKVSKQNGLKIVHTNCCSLYNKINQIQYLFKDVDFLACTETWLHEQYSNELLQLNGKTLFRLDRGAGLVNGISKKRGGGVCWYIDNDYAPYVNICEESSFVTNEIEILTLKINKYAHHKNMLLVVVYRPPSGNVTEFIDQLRNAINRQDCDRYEKWIVGDFNIDYSSRNKTCTKALYEFAREECVRQVITSPTRYSVHGNTCIDLIFTNADHITLCGTLADQISDHMAVFVIKKKTREKIKYKKIRGRTYKAYDSEILTTLLSHESWFAFYESNDPNNKWNIIQGYIENHLNIMCPYKMIRVREDSTPWITNEIRELINDRNIAQKRANETGKDEDRKHARTLRNQVNARIIGAKESFVKNTLEETSDNPKKFWRNLNDLLGRSKNDTVNVMFTQENGMDVSAENSADYLNRYFAQIGSTLADSLPSIPPHRTYGDQYNIIKDDIVRTITEQAVLEYVKNIDVNKSSGIDTIPSFILKDCFVKMIPELTNLFNCSLNTGIFPDVWSIAKITPIPKSGDLKQPKNWRPISILPLPGKLLEKCCYGLIEHHLEGNNIISNQQFGFRKGRSTSHATFELVKYISENVNNHQYVSCLYLDMAKAFDSISHSILLSKLEHIGLHRVLRKWLASYLGNRKIITKLNGHESSPLDLNTGVPQGSCLGPQLFIIYINALTEAVNMTNCKSLLYADDAVIYTSGNDIGEIENSLQQVSNNISNWCIQNRLVINAEKSKLCTYGTKNMLKNIPPLSVNINNHYLSNCHVYDYLGVSLDEKLTLESHYNKMTKNYSFSLYKLSKLRKCLSKKTRILIY